MLGAGCAAGLLLGALWYHRACSAEETPRLGRDTRGIKLLSPSAAGSSAALGRRSHAGRLTPLCILTHKIDYKQERITLI